VKAQSERTLLFYIHIYTPDVLRIGFGIGVGAVVGLMRGKGFSRKRGMGMHACRMIINVNTCIPAYVYTYIL